METTAANKELLSQIFAGSWITQGIAVAAELGLADLLAEGPCTTDDLARRTNTHSGSLFRVLRALAGVGIFAQDPQGRFALTPLAKALCTDGAESQRAMATMMGAEFHGAWGELLHSVRTGEPGFERRYGVPFFQYMTQHPQRHGLYDAAMAAYGVAETEAMLGAYDLSAVRTLVDVGGGNGRLLAGVLERYPAMKGTLFDLPAVADRAGDLMSDSGLSDRCDIVGGDFFSSVPSGADAYVLRHIIHDWNDDEAVAILRNCREAMHPHSRILVVETVIPLGNEPCFAKWLDLMMLLVGGCERTLDQYRRLFSEAGLTLERVVGTAAEVSVIEGTRQAQAGSPK